jgi:formylglycine-generating enzyme required for sulfatase activity
MGLTGLARLSVLAIAVFAAFGCHARTDAQSPAADAATAAKVDALAKSAQTGMVKIRGGDFRMGDFGEIASDEKLPYRQEADNKPLHKVHLSDFTLSRYKVTNDEYDVYASANGQPTTMAFPWLFDAKKKYRRLPRAGAFPAEVLWADAAAYCKWLGGKVGRPMDLPTEAQWEYAARAGGKFLVYATDNGQFDEGRNVPAEDDVEKLSGDAFAPIPVGLYPANALGLFDMGKNGREWMRDWYAEDYYAHSPASDPKGPDSGAMRVVRSHENGTHYPAMTMERSSRLPDGSDPKQQATEKSLGMSPTLLGYSFRCAGN